MRLLTQLGGLRRGLPQRSQHGVQRPAKADPPRPAVGSPEGLAEAANLRATWAFITSTPNKGRDTPASAMDRECGWIQNFVAIRRPPTTHACARTHTEKGRHDTHCFHHDLGAK